jgi:hypothetical protein
MKTAAQPLLLSALLLSAVPFYGAGSPIAGTWWNRSGTQPHIKLAVTDISGELSGTMWLYSIYKDRQPRHAHPYQKFQLLNPRFDGRTFRFETGHRGLLPPHAIDPRSVVRYELELTGPDEGKLNRLDNRPWGNPWMMTRDPTHKTEITPQAN